MRLLISALTALMLLFATPVVAGDFEDGAVAYKAGDHQKAVLPVWGGCQDSLSAIGTVLEAVGAGMITPAEGQAVAYLVEAYRRTFEVKKLENRLNILEEQLCAAH